MIVTEVIEMGEILRTSDDTIYLTYKDKVYSYVRSRVNREQDAEDIVSTVFLKVYQKLHTYNSDLSSISTWIYTITKNTLTDYYRKEYDHADISEWEDVLSESDEANNAMLESLAFALTSLKDKERELIILHYSFGYSLKAISEKMGMSYINAKVIHSKALSKLRDKMAEE